MRKLGSDLYPRRRRRGKNLGIAALVGGAIAAMVMKWVGFGANKPDVAKAPQSERVVTEVALPAPNESANDPRRQGQAESDTEGATGVARFDFYTLALSLAPAFCELEPKRKQCRQLTASEVAKTPLTLHGLWPEYTGAGRYPSDCAGAKFRLADIDTPQLRRLMPGVSDGLASHEWRKHGTCSGLDSQTYFAAALSEAERLNSAIGRLFDRDAGRIVETQRMRAEVEQLLPGVGKAITFHCRNIASVAREMRSTPILTEVRVCYQRGPAGQLAGYAECASFDRIDQGCGKRFGIDTP
jgi:ribonuclease I